MSNFSYVHAKVADESFEDNPGNIYTLLRKFPLTQPELMDLLIYGYHDYLSMGTLRHIVYLIDDKPELIAYICNKKFRLLLKYIIPLNLITFDMILDVNRRYGHDAAEYLFESTHQKCYQCTNDPCLDCLDI